MEVHEFSVPVESVMIQTLVIFDPSVEVRCYLSAVMSDLEVLVDVFALQTVLDLSHNLDDLDLNAAVDASVPSSEEWVAVLMKLMTMAAWLQKEFPPLERTR